MFTAAALLVSRWVHGLCGIERRRQPHLLTEIARPIPEFWSANPGRFVLSHKVAVSVLAQDVVDEQILGDDDVALESNHLGDVGDASGAIAQTRRLNDDVDGGADHFADGAGR